MPELEEEPRLADARVTGNSDDLALAPDRGAQAALEQLEVMLAPDEPRHPCRRPQSRDLRADEAVSRDGGGRDRLQIPAPLQKGNGRRAHHDAGVAAGVQQGVQRHGHFPLGVVVDLDGVAHVADHRLGDVNGHRHASLERQIAHPRRGALDRHGGVRRATGGVLDRLQPERSDEAACAQLLDAAAEGADLVHELFDQAGRVTAARRADDDAEHRHPAALPSQASPGERRRRGRHDGASTGLTRSPAGVAFGAGGAVGVEAGPHAVGASRCGNGPCSG